MYRYAQSNLQLHHQLCELGYAKEEVNDIQNTYKLAMELFAGYFQANGKEFLAHAVGTASILASLNVSPNVVAAGLLHNIYGRGDFGDGQSGITPARQELVRNVVGETTEHLLVMFHSMWWNPNLFRSIRDHLPQYDRTKRAVVLLHLADHLEHNLDYGTGYYSDIERPWRTSNTDILADMAEILEVPSLAQDIRHAYQMNSTYEVSSEFRSAYGVTSGSILAPKSCWKCFMVTMNERWLHWVQGYHDICTALGRRVRMTLKTLKQKLTTS
jgi:(p)ppGpp synthase/HD superfamily hydrolase